MHSRIIIVGFVAGIIARLLSPGPNNPSGFILTTVLGIAGAFLATLIGQSIGHYEPGPGRRLHHRDDRRAGGAVHLEPAGGEPRDFRSRREMTAQPSLRDDSSRFHVTRCTPASIRTTSPVMLLDRGVARKHTSSATSSAVEATV